jgi:outer membrane protein assembly factor BamA
VDNPALSGAANKYFYRFGRTIVRANADFQHPIGVPEIRLFMGAGVRSQTVQTVPFDSGTTLLAQQLGRGALPAQQATFARLGVVVDTRDNEISTTRGNWSELLVMRAGKTLGGDEVFTRITGTIRQYASITSDLVLAQRVVMQTVRGELPITDFSLIQNSYRDYEGLGGSTTIRGIPRNRFQGKGIAFSNTELRWSAAQFDVLKHSTRLVLSGFVDTGRVWEQGFDVATILDGLHTGYGGGVHFEVGPTFIITGDVGHSNLSTAAIYLGLGYLF